MRASTVLMILSLAGAAEAQDRRSHPYVIRSSSMEPTLREGEFVMADRRPDDCGDVGGFGPGDVAVRLKEETPHISRIIAGPGQTVEVRAGIPVIDGEAATVAELGEAELGLTYGRRLQETLPNGRSYQTFRISGGAPNWLDDFPAIRLGADEWFLMGDNRLNAVDSRIDGPVKTPDLCGRLVHIYASPDSERLGPLR